MAEDKIIPSDIQADADRLYPNAAHRYSLKSKLKRVYIQGRIDERNKQNKSKL